MAEAATAEGASNAETPPISATSTQSGPPATINETLTYRKQLDGPAPVDTLGAEKPSRSAAARPDAPPPAPAPAPETPSAPAAKTAEAPPPAPAPPAKAAAPPPAASAASAEPAGPGFAIQVAALRERTEAEAVVKRLTGKGYAAYVVAPAPGTAAVYRVRVGKFKERREANSVAARLQKEEQFKPWIVR
jgi:cell division septation protein DedD